MCVCACKCVSATVCMWRSDNFQELVLLFHCGIQGPNSRHQTHATSKYFCALSHLPGPNATISDCFPTSY